MSDIPIVFSRRPMVEAAAAADDDHDDADESPTERGEERRGGRAGAAAPTIDKGIPPSPAAALFRLRSRVWWPRRPRKSAICIIGR